MPTLDESWSWKCAQISRSYTYAMLENHTFVDLLFYSVLVHYVFFVDCELRGRAGFQLGMST